MLVHEGARISGPETGAFLSWIGKIEGFGAMISRGVVWRLPSSARVAIELRIDSGGSREDYAGTKRNISPLKLTADRKGCRKPIGSRIFN